MAPEQLTVAAYLTRWLEVIKPTLRYSTWRRHEQIVRLHLLPLLGEVAMSDLSPDHLERLYADRLATGLAPATVQRVHNALHKAMRRAHRQGIVERNVVALVDPPRIARVEMRTLTPAEAKRFLATSSHHRLHALFVLALAHGMRQGELIGLRWHQVDLERRLLRITAGAALTENGREIADTKTRRSRRPITLSDLAVCALERHRALQLAERAKHGPGWNELDLVFTNTVGRMLEPANLLRRTFHSLLDAADLPRMRFHDLRHTFATLALEAGIHPRVVSDMLGHASVQLTLDRYSHVNQAVQSDAAERISRMLE